MATKTTTNSSAKKLEGWLGKEAGSALYAYLRDARRKDGGRIYADLDAEIKNLKAPLFMSPPPQEADIHFDVKKLDLFLRFCRLLRHVKGSRWAGRRLEPDLWQVVFVLAPLFGWRNSEGLRLYRTLYLEIPKKNGKSTLAAALALYLLTADGEPGAEVVSAAGDREQARAVYDVASFMAKAAPAIRKRVRIGVRQLTFEERASWFKVLSADGDLKAGLNLHGGIIDELLVQKTRRLVDNLEGATGSRSQPLIAYLTTAGIDDPGTIYAEKRDYAEKVARGDLEDPTWLSVIYTIPDPAKWNDEKAWQAANPGLGKSLRLDYLQRKAKQAAANPASLNTFLRDHLNVRTGQVTRWVSIEKWDRSTSRWLNRTEEQLKGLPAFGGLDLSSAVDLATIVLLVPEVVKDPKTDELITILRPVVRAWTPADTVAQRAERDRAPYLEWIQKGYLLTTPGDVIDYDAIEEEAFKLADHFEVRRIQFDRWGSKQLTQHLDEGGLEMLEMGQGFASMSPPMKETERLILQGRIAHGGNPLLRWAVQSLAVKQDPAGNIKPDRDKSTGRIDPFVAMVMAVDAWTRGKDVRSAYEDHGLQMA